MLPLLSWFTLMPLNFINVRPVFWLFVENEHEIQFKTWLQDFWNYFCKLYNLEIFQNFYCKMYHLKNSADQMKIITSVVDGWTRWSWELALKRKSRPTFENTCITQFRAVNKISAPPRMCVLFPKMDTHSIHKGGYFFVMCYSSFLKYPLIKDWNFFPVLFWFYIHPWSPPSSPPPPPPCPPYPPCTSPFHLQVSALTQVNRSFPNIQETPLNAPQPSYLCFVSYPTGWQHHLKGDYKH